MSRLIHHRDMNAAEIVGCAYDALALIELAEHASFNLQPSSPQALFSSITNVLSLAGEMLGPVIDALESHEGVKSDATDEPERAEE
jgi:hypothetical protein